MIKKCHICSGISSFDKQCNCSILKDDRISFVIGHQYIEGDISCIGQYTFPCGNQVFHGLESTRNSMLNFANENDPSKKWKIYKLSSLQEKL